MASKSLDLEAWQSKRRLMFANFCLGSYAFGLSLTAYYPTEFYYFKDTMKIEKPDLFYGLSWAFLCASGVISSLLGSYYADSTKNVREVCLLSNLINVIGNVLYLLYYSPYLVLLGQFLVGTAAARMVAGVGEISRVYKSTELTQNLSILGIFSTLGAVTGPCTTFLFQMVDKNVGDWRLDINNMVGVTMGSLYLLQLIINFFTLENVSKIYNVKEEESKMALMENMTTEGDESENIEPVEELTFQAKYTKALLMLLQNKHILFLYALSFFASFARATITLLQPIKSVEFLSWTQIDLATFHIICTVAGAIPTAIILTILSKRVNDFFLLLFTLVALLFALILMAITPIVQHHIRATNILMYGNGILTLISTAGFHIMSRSMLAKFVPENVQTVTEAIRNALFEMSYMIAGLSVKLPAEYLSASMFFMAAVLCFSLVWLLVEQKFYRNVQIISEK